jgi:hypothetical protein
MVQQHKQNMYASHFTNYLLGFLAYMNTNFSWSKQGLKPKLAGLVVTNSYHPPYTFPQPTVTCKIPSFQIYAKVLLLVLLFLAFLVL